MKQLKKIHVMAIALTLSLATGGLAIASENIKTRKSKNLDSHTVEVSADDFKTLSDISADAMDPAEMDQVQGKQGTVILRHRHTHPQEQEPSPSVVQALNAYLSLTGETMGGEIEKNPGKK